MEDFQSKMITFREGILSNIIIITNEIAQLMVKLDDVSTSFVT